MALASTYQDDFSGGIYRGRRAPENAVYDATNVLVNDEGQLFRRGGSAYKTTSDAAETILGLAVANLTVGARVALWGASRFMVLDSAETSTVTTSTSIFPTTQSRGVVISGVLLLPYFDTPATSNTTMVVYGGSYKTADSAGGLHTVTVTNGSKTVAGVGTTWSGAVDAGMILRVTGQDDYHGVVSSVTSNTSLELTEPWGGTTQAGAFFDLKRIDFFRINVPLDAQPYFAAVSSPPRLIAVIANNVYFSPRGLPYAVASAGTYHALPSDAIGIGADSIGSTALAMTTAGIWGISNLDLDPVDDFGNIQHDVAKVSDLILWGDSGIAALGDQRILPCVDDVWLFGLDGATPITGSRNGNPYDGGIRDYYRSYVAAGYRPGIATVHRGHYFLPILSNASTLVDVLVCNLARGFAWTRWTGHAAGLAYGQRIGSAARSPKLFSAAGLRVADLTGCFAPTSSNASDADGTAAPCTIITRDYPTSQQRGFVQRIRARCELTGTGSPTVTPEYSSDQDAGTFTTITDKGEQSGGAGWGKSDGSLYQWARVGKKRERIRFRFTQAGAATSFVWRSLEMLTRPPGRQ